MTVRMPRPIWLPIESPDNPFPFEVLDCRATCAALAATIRDDLATNAVASLVTIAEAVGAPTLPPDCVRGDPEIVVPSSAPDQSGPVIAESDVECRWSLRRIDRQFHARRRWTGQLIHVADFVLRDGSVAITGLGSRRDFVHNSFAYAAAEFAFLAETYIGGRLAAFPIPPRLRRDEPEKIAMSGWKTHGSAALFARFVPELI